MIKSPEDAQELKVTQAVKLLEETALRGKITKMVNSLGILQLF